MCRMCVWCSICGLNIRNYYCYFLCREYVLYIWSWMFFLFGRRTLVDNPGILVDKFHFYYIYLVAAVALVCSVFCYAYGRPLLFSCLEKLCDCSYFHTAVCEDSPLCFLLLWVIMYVLFLLFLGGGGSLLSKFLSWSLLHSTFWMVFISASFAFSVIGYEYNRFTK
jgi:hypothetical protein